MGTLKYVNRDLFSSDRPILAHSVNCLGKFGAGVAKQIGVRFPDVKWAYLRRHRTSRWSPGDVQFVLLEDDRVVANMAMQLHYGRKGCHVDYDAVRGCFVRLLDFCVWRRQGVAMPKVGAGLGGGDWSRVEEILVDCLLTRSVEVDVHIFTPPAS